MPEAKPLLGDAGFSLFCELQEGVHRKIITQYGPVEPINIHLSWITGRGERCSCSDESAEYKSFDVHHWLESHPDWLEGTYAPHVDKANMPEYDVSALPYLSTAGTDFEGGLFAFNDPAHGCLVEPRAGRLLAFESDFDNLHHVRPVTTGERLALSIWYRENGSS